MATLSDILQKFSSISLDDMDNVKLMNRSDTKYIFRKESLPDILEQLTKDYFVLDIDGVRNSRYNTVYYDTGNFTFYHQHRRGKANRHKVRLRTYVESDRHYFEIKHKSNKGRTVKDRIRRKEHNIALSEKAENFLFDKTRLKPEDLMPKLWASFSRITLVNKNIPERLTIDTELIYKNEDKEKSLPDLVIAEVKQEKKRRSVFDGLMHKHRFQEVSISKYCFGIIFLYEDIRMNNFKPKLTLLNKLFYEKS